MRALVELGVAPVVLDAAGCRAIEPGLNPATPLHAGIYSKDDEVGNCREFTHLLRKEAERAGARFRFNAHVEQIRPGAGAELARPCRRRTTHATRRCARATASEWPTTQPQAGETTEPSFDAIVVCAALESRPLLKPLGVRLPLLAVHGYSVTAPLRHDDAHLHLEPARRADGRALQGRDQPPRPARPRRRQRRDRRRRRAPERAACRPRSTRCSTTGSPASTQRSAAQRWKGARPMLPDGPPVLGPSGAEGVWLNVGHGGSGWALAAGSARLVADAIAGRKTPIGIDGLGIERLKA